MARHLQIDVITVHFSGSFLGTMQYGITERIGEQENCGSFWGTRRTVRYFQSVPYLYGMELVLCSGDKSFNECSVRFFTPDIF